MELDARMFIEIILLAAGLFFGWQAKAFYDKRFLKKNGITKKQFEKRKRNTVGQGGGR